jgi:glycerophosphoryl diester phosphodiesterase
MRRLLYIALSTFISAAAATTKIEVQGHRGARWVRPENTLPAFQYALENSVDVIEMDMNVTKDNVLVIAHDPFLNPKICVDSRGRTISDRVLIRSLTLRELQSYDCGSKVNPDFPAQRTFAKTPIPTLNSVFEMVMKSARPNSRTIQFNIETKSDPAHPNFTPSPENFVKLFLRSVRKYKMLERVTLQSFDYRTLKAAHDLEPSLKLSLLIDEQPKETGALTRLVKDYSVDVLSPNFRWLTIGDVEEMHKLNVRVIPWTVNQPADWQRMLTIGVDGLITDNPKALLDYLKLKTKD